MNYILMLIFLVIAVPCVFFYMKGSLLANRFTIDREMKEELDVIAKDALRQKGMSHMKPIEFRDIRSSPREDGGKNIEIDTHLVDVKNQNLKWTHVGMLVRIIAVVDKNGQILHLDVKSEHTKDTGQLIPEDTNSISKYSATISGKLREYVGMTLYKTEDSQVPSHDLETCSPGGGMTSAMCKNPSKARTEVPFAPTTTDFEERYAQLNNEIRTNQDLTESKFQCKLIKPYFSEIGTPRGQDRLVCKERYDLDDNPWVAKVDKSAKDNIKGVGYSLSNPEDEFEKLVIIDRK